MKKLLTTIALALLIFGTKAEAEEIVTVKAVPEQEYEMLAHMIFCEGGSDWLPDEVPYGVGTVILNRIKDSRFPDTMYGVIHQPGQYAVAGFYMSKTPTQRCYDIAYDLLANGSTWPENVVYQAQFRQGSGTYLESSGEYFCY